MSPLLKAPGPKPRQAIGVGVGGARVAVARGGGGGVVGVAAPMVSLLTKALYFLWAEGGDAMKVSTKGDYGVRALIELAHHYGEG
ncbi:MAG: hypothetical protein ACE5IZ_09450, partial [Dehalococcoidia bacterium]